MKVIKRILKITVWMLILLLVAVFLALQFPAVQTSLAFKVTEKLSENIAGKLGMDKVLLALPNKIVAKDFYITGPAGDTLLKTAKLAVNLRRINPLGKTVHLGDINIGKGYFVLATDEEGTDLEKAFASPNPVVQDTVRTAFAWTILAKGVHLKDFAFRLLLQDQQKAHLSPNTIDFTDMHLSQMDIDISGIRLDRNSLSARIDHIACREKCGYTLRDFQGNVEVDAHKASVYELIIRDDFSLVTADHFHMHYGTVKNFKYYTRKVKMELALNQAVLSFRTLQAYAPGLDGIQTTLRLHGKTTGTVCDLSSDALGINTLNGKTRLLTAFRISGLPSVGNTTLDFRILRLHTTAADLSDILQTVYNTDLRPTLSRLPEESSVELRGKVQGPLLAPTIAMNMESTAGNLQVHAVADAIHRPATLQMRLHAQDVQLGNLLGTKSLGSTSLFTKAHITFNHERQGGPILNLDSLFIPRMGLMGQSYTGISGAGRLTGSGFDGEVSCSDPHLRFFYRGRLGFGKGEKGLSKFTARLHNIDLKRLGLMPRDAKALLQGEIQADIQRDKANRFMGNVTLRDACYTNAAGKFFAGQTHLSSLLQDSTYLMSVQSGILDASYEGKTFITEYAQQLLTDLVEPHVSRLWTAKHRKTDPDSLLSPARLTAVVKDASLIAQLVAPRLYLAPGTRITLTTEPDGATTLNTLSDRIGYGPSNIKSLNLNLYADSSGIKAKAATEYLAAAGMRLAQACARVSAAHHTALGRMTYASPKGADSLASLEVHARFLAPGHIQCHIPPSYVKLGTAQWDLGSHTIEWNQGALAIKDFVLRHMEEYIRIDGRYSQHPSDTLTLDLRNFDLGLVNLLSERFQFSGRLTGNAQMTRAGEGMRFFADIRGNSIAVNRDTLGRVKLNSYWASREKALRFDLTTQHGTVQAIRGGGFYRPAAKQIDATAVLHRFPASLASPFTQGIVHDLSGSVSGQFRASGTLPKLYLTSENARFNGVGLTVDYTGVGYTLNGAFDCTRHGITFSRDSVTDAGGHTAILHGEIKHEAFRRLNMNLGFDLPSNFHALNTKLSDNKDFFGSAYASGGRFTITGGLRQLEFGLNTRTDKGTVIHIPLSGVSEAKSSNLLSFTAPAPKVPEKYDPYNAPTEGAEKDQKATKIGVDLQIEATPDAEMVVEISRANGDALHAKGEGAIHIRVNPQTDAFTINGQYNLTDGSYPFSLQGLVSKKLSLKPGGNISFTGDILKSGLDMTAAYNTKASLATLLADSTSIGNRRPVECQIRIRGELMNPSLGFNIEIQDIDPTTQARVQAALNTEDKMLRQFMTLLVSNSFMPEQESGIVNNGSVLYSNVTEILSNQINNIFNQLDIPLDVGFNYQPGNFSGNGRDVFDVAISTQLFNNRVIVNGNVGNTQYNRSNNIVGDIDIEFKLDDRGKYRLKAFSHSADQYSNYLDNTQRNGGGFVYQDEFRSFKDLFKRKKKNRAAPSAAFPRETRHDTPGKK